MHCTGQTSTQARSFTSMQASVMIARPAMGQLLECVVDQRVSGTGLQLADREMRGEHRLTDFGSQPRVSLGCGLGAVAGLLQLDHRVAGGYAVDHVPRCLRELVPELPND